MSVSAPDVPDFDSMTKAQLMAFGKENGIEGLDDRMLKADIIAAIKEAMGWTQT